MSMDAVPDKARSSRVTTVRKKHQALNSTIASSVSFGLGQYLKTLGLDGAHVLRAAGIKPFIHKDRYSRIPIQQLVTAFEFSELTANDPLIGLHFGAWYNPPVLYAFHYAIECAPDLRMALNSVQDHRNLVADMPTQISDLGAFTEMSWSIGPPSSCSRHMIDFIAMRTLNHIQQATGTEWKPLRVNLAYEKPDNMDEYTRLLGPKVHFDQPANGFWIDPAAMATPMPAADPDMYYIALNSFRNPFPCEQDDTNPIDRIRRYLSLQLGKNSISLASVSKHMGMTSQQLHRLLKKRGTCFQCVLDETRKAHAAHFLSETETCFSEITFLLGFSDQSTFSRAVKRWFGTTPKDIRRASAG